jgi:hypothetical protein
MLYKSLHTMPERAATDSYTAQRLSQQLVRMLSDCAIADHELSCAYSGALCLKRAPQTLQQSCHITARDHLILHCVP